ncbi:cytochrome c oxidase subunit 7C, mitochondrial [Acipenser oxyrinchus oxyrinchus]|uniref:Cytochrome c oxidase subunit 7C, mitochondrial n=1 Tax=Acipenser oxyrinchus oxyrinchus TaxID=40147 RepID=A0AAD8GM30_ACIOX|nr:cytochrome c oxidase subunit 7C, mitochondrial [Acipenser oxyrinchus oxyrinchus]
MLGQAVRRFTTSAIRRSHYGEGPGKNLPFSIENKWRLLGMMVTPAAEEVKSFNVRWIIYQVCFTLESIYPADY